MPLSRITLLSLVGCVLGCVSPAWAAVINADIDTSAGSTHVGDDGVLSTPGGSTWNRLLFDQNLTGLADENGNSTPVSVEYLTNNNFSVTDPASTNDIQDITYMGEGFQILNLVPGASYDFAAYIGFNTGFDVIDLNGDNVTNFGNTPTYNLPGVQDSDYRLLSGLIPFDTGGGVFGLEVTGIDGTIGGFQLSGTVVPEPASASLLLMMIWALQRRRQS